MTFSRLNGWLAAKAHVLLGALMLGNLVWPQPALGLKGVHLFDVPWVGWSYDFSTCALTLMMLSASVQCRAADFGELLRQRRPAAAFLGLNYVAGPLLAWVLSTAALAQFSGAAAFELRLGLFFVALMPIALTSAVWVRLSAGNVAFSLAMIGLTTLVSVASVPAYIQLMPASGGMSPAAPLVRQLVMAVTLPLCAGLAFRWALPRWAERAQPLLGVLGQLALYAALSTNIAAAAVRLPNDHEILWTASGATLLLNGALFGLALGAARLLRLRPPGMPHANAVALVLSCGMRSTGTAMVVAGAAFPEMALVTLPAALFSVSQQALVGLLRPWVCLGSRVWRAPAGLSHADVVAHVSQRVAQGAARPRVIVVRARREVSCQPDALAQMVDAVQQRLRPYDFVSRLDDHSVGVVLWDLSDRQARRVARRLRRAVEGSAAPQLRCRVRTLRRTPEQGAPESAAVWRAAA